MAALDSAPRAGKRTTDAQKRPAKAPATATSTAKICDALPRDAGDIGDRPFISEIERVRMRERIETEIEPVLIARRTNRVCFAQWRVFHQIARPSAAPGFIERAWILHREGDVQPPAALHDSEALNDVKLSGVRRAIAVHECLVVLADSIDHKRVAFVMADRFSVQGR